MKENFGRSIKKIAVATVIGVLIGSNIALYHSYTDASENVAHYVSDYVEVFYAIGRYESDAQWLYNLGVIPAEEYMTLQAERTKMKSLPSWKAYEEVLEKTLTKYSDNTL